jgi:3-hydroxybutyryl-CoA dehydrogenase
MMADHRIAVIGGGLMGAGIAQVFAAAGIPVAVYEPTDAVRATIPQRIRVASEAVAVDADAVLKHVTVPASLVEAVAGRTLVIEAGPEQLGVKRSIFGELDDLVDADTILASNTSSIPIGEITAGLSHRAHSLGIHFWNPPSIVRLAEVIRSTALDSIVDDVVELLTAVGMSPVIVEADVPGFVGNRLQHALKREAIALVANGICSAETVDTVVRLGFGSRLAAVGPLEQSDLNGLELTLAIHEVVMPVLDVTPVPHPYLVALVEAGNLGAKTGQGFYEWTPQRAERRRAEIAAALNPLLRKDAE